MDSQMPLLSGEETTRLIREYETINHMEKTPIVAVSALVYDYDRDRFFNAGMDDFLAKPIILRDLKRVIEQWLSHSSTDLLKENHIPDVVDDILVFDYEGMLSRLGGNKQLAENIFTSAITEIPKFLDRLNECIHESHWTEAQMVLHTLKGLALQIGGERFARDLIKLEKTVRDGFVINLSEVQLLKDGFEDLVEARKKQQ